MLIGQSPFAGEDEDDLFASICRDRVYFPKWISEAAISVLNGVCCCCFLLVVVAVCVVTVVVVVIIIIIIIVTFIAVVVVVGVVFAFCSYCRRSRVL